ncbi:hypothetical protein lilo_1452 [Lactococcus lactis subsp. lactis IO-1]|nr:hypothetical protein lilo_1452 [Lactococcus lactis subsp. lactis IO-1]
MFLAAFLKYFQALLLKMRLQQNENHFLKYSLLELCPQMHKFLQTNSDESQLSL